MSLAIESVLISESVDPSCESILSQNGISTTTKVGLTAEQLKSEIQNYHGLIVRSATKVTSDIIAAGKNLKIIGRAGVGVDNIDCDAATKHGVLVINAPGGNTLSAAELTCCMITSLSRSIPEACATLKNGKWDRKRFMANELNGKTLAIIGLGRIGREVAFRMQAFGMKTIGFDPLVPAEESIKFGVETIELSEIWPLADYITVHTPLIPQTKNMLNKETFAKCRKGVKVVNCARGGIIDEDALFDALESGQCGGAGLDVYLEEPPKNTKLIQHPKVICTPHLGASTHEAQSRVAVEISEQMVALNQGQSAHGIVNSPAFSLSMSSANRDGVVLSKTVGHLIASLFANTESEITVSVNVHGTDLHRKEIMFSTAVLIGMLQQRKKAANFVNAPTLAKDLGFTVEKVSTGPPKGHNLSVEVVASSANQKHSALVTLKGSNDPVLCAIDGHSFKVHPLLAGHLILLKSSLSSALTLCGSLIEKGVIDNASWSSCIDGKSWSVLNSNKPADLANIGHPVDFYAQISL
ncbi:D-3-phosphoglycerate dehydrogenase [Parasteatoda tepidariorum]|uniref:D-3-phosphoglycerate dehydrogenase n=1 Tax=Parasteatoda tepidariorum TaxID=114398 RepID=UPI000A2C05FD|nr:D-3-phosphoglycerate dehydrogenase [Parasteatoda tepidariorum]